MNSQTILLAVSVLLSTLGCASTRRSVTHVRVEHDKAYVAYAEWEDGGLTFITGSKDRSRVKRCAINPDNTLSCEEDADINAILNPQEGNAPPPRAAAKKKAVAEEAPPPVDEPEASEEAAPEPQSEETEAAPSAS